jgi:uncharacterized protein (TIGR02246 family)
MRHLTSLLLLVVVVGCATQNAARDARSEIERARDEFWDVHGRGDAAALAGFLTDDAVLMAPGMPDIRSRAAIRTTAEQMFAGMRIADFKIHSSEIDVCGDTAYEVSTYSETLHPSVGTATPVQGRYLIVWKRGTDGRWRIHRNLFNLAAGTHP